MENQIIPFPNLGAFARENDGSLIAEVLRPPHSFYASQDEDGQHVYVTAFVSFSTAAKMMSVFADDAVEVS